MGKERAGHHERTALGGTYELMMGLLCPPPNTHSYGCPALNDPQLAAVSPAEGEKLFNDMLENQKEYLPKAWF